MAQMSETLTVAAGQMAAEPLTRASASREAVERLARRAADRRAELLVLPECAYPAYALGSPQDYRSADVMSPDEYLDFVASLARELSLHIVTGYVADDDGHLFNAACLIDRHGRVLGRYDKQMLWDADHGVFTPGTRIETVDTELGRIGMIICADARVPEIIATLAAAGAQLVAMPTGWVTVDDPAGPHRNPQPEFLVSARAREFSLPFVCANKAGPETDTVAFCGRSMVVRADGVILAEAPAQDETLIVSRLRMSTRSTPRRVWMAEARRTRLLSDPPADVDAKAAGTVAVAVMPRTVMDDHAGDDGGASYFASLKQRGISLLMTNVRYDASAEAMVQVGALHDVAVAAFPSSSKVRNLADLRVGLIAGQAAKSFASARALALDGAEVLCIFTGSIDLGLLRSRAIENRVYVVAVSEHESAVIAPDGGTLARGDPDSPHEVTFTLDRARSADKTVVPDTDVFGARQPAAYRF